MAQVVELVPTGDMRDLPFSIQEWVRKVTNLIAAGTVGSTWVLLDKTGSNLADILTRNHNDLQNKQGGTSGEYYHLTSADYTGTGTGVVARKTGAALITPNVGVAAGTSLALTSFLTSATVATASFIRPGTDAGVAQTACGLYAGTGAPDNANGQNGDYYFRSDGGVGTHIYFRAAGAWAGLI